MIAETGTSAANFPQAENLSAKASKLLEALVSLKEFAKLSTLEVVNDAIVRKPDRRSED